MVCTNDTSRDFLDNLELKSALAIPEQKFDIIAFDACLMSMFEIIYQVKDSANKSLNNRYSGRADKPLVH
jgi:hypothetical protein